MIKSDKTQSIIKIIVVMFYVKISCHIKMLKYYTNNVLLGRQAYCENSGVKFKYCCRAEHMVLNYSSRIAVFGDEAGAFLSAGGRIE